MEKIFQKIKELIKNQTGKDITLNSNLRDLGIDSLELLDFIVKAEKEFKIQIDDSELINLTTIKDIVEAIENKLK